MIRFEAAIERALDGARRAAASFHLEPESRRAYGCAASGCSRSAISKGLCNAHYLRQRKGVPMDGPLNARKRADSCSECGETTGARGAWGLCNKHYKSRRYAVIKDALIEAMGGACSRCAGCFHRSVFDFHHVGEKTDAPSAVLQNGAPAEIAAEMARCVLLCANCHRLEHHDAGL